MTKQIEVITSALAVGVSLVKRRSNSLLLALNKEAVRVSRVMTGNGFFYIRVLGRKHIPTMAYTPKTSGEIVPLIQIA